MGKEYRNKPRARLLNRNEVDDAPRNNKTNSQFGHCGWYRSLRWSKPHTIELKTQTKKAQQTKLFLQTRLVGLVITTGAKTTLRLLSHSNRNWALGIAWLFSNTWGRGVAWRGNILYGFSISYHIQYTVRAGSDTERVYRGGGGTDCYSFSPAFGVDRRHVKLVEARYVYGVCAIGRANDHSVLLRV